MTAVPASERPKVSLLYNPRVRTIAYQALLCAVIAFLAWSAVTNAIENLRRAHIASGFEFWNFTSGFDISQSLINYSSTSTYGRAFWVGLINTLAQEGAKYNIKANALAPVARTRMTEDILGPMADKLDPKLVAPIVAWLAHEDCPVTGEIYSAAGGRIARFFIGLTEGYYNPDLTLEDVRDHFDQIRDETGYIVPKGPGDEFAQLMKHFSS